MLGVAVAKVPGSLSVQQSRSAVGGGSGRRVEEDCKQNTGPGISHDTLLP